MGEGENFKGKITTKNKKQIKKKQLGSNYRTQN